MARINALKYSFPKPSAPIEKFDFKEKPKWFEVTAVKPSGETGKTIGFARAENWQRAAKIAFSKSAKGKGRVRVFPVKFIKRK